MKNFQSLKPKSFKLKARQGMTLLETLIYAAIFATMMGFVIIVLFQIVDTQRGHQGRVEVETEANFVMRKLSWALEGAQSINSPAAGASSSQLSINKFNFSQNPLVFGLVAGTVQLARGASSAIPLTNSSVEVTELTFEHLAPSGARPDGVKVTLSLTASSSANIVKATTTLKNTIYLEK